MAETEHPNGNESGTITIKKDSLWKYSTFVLLAVVVIVGFFMLKPSGGTGAVVDTLVLGIDGVDR